LVFGCCGLCCGFLLLPLGFFLCFFVVGMGPAASPPGHPSGLHTRLR
jgi:hypothetical protein